MKIFGVIFFKFSFILYLKQFSVHENKTTEEILASIECCPKGEILS
jgi:hypothetical protein